MYTTAENERSRMIEENMGLVHACAHKFKGCLLYTSERAQQYADVHGDSMLNVSEQERRQALVAVSYTHLYFKEGIG